MFSGEFYQFFFETVWLTWCVIWVVFSLNVKNTVQRQATLPRLLNTGLLFCAFLLLWPLPMPLAALTARFLPSSEWQFWVPLGAALTLVGLLFTVWARVYLGRNWSGVAAVKAGHELITGGPYALVRHPIYTGLLLAVVGTGLATGEWRAVLSVVLALIAIVHRMIVEESFMRQQFGAAYVDYARRVRALVPGVI